MFSFDIPGTQLLTHVMATASALDEATLSEIKRALNSFLGKGQILKLEVWLTGQSWVDDYPHWREVYWYVCENQDPEVEQGHAGGVLKVLMFL